MTTTRRFFRPTWAEVHLGALQENLRRLRRRLPRSTRILFVVKGDGYGHGAVACARAAEKAGVVYCIEPLSRHETNFVNTVAEAVQVVDAIASPAFRTMIDTSAAGLTEGVPVADLIRKWMPTGKIAHVQLNDTNRRGPGQGSDAFGPILSALKRTKYAGVAAVEPFVYQPDGPTTAAVSIGYVRGVLEALK